MVQLTRVGVASYVSAVLRSASVGHGAVGQGVGTKSVSASATLTFTPELERKRATWPRTSMSVKGFERSRYTTHAGLPSGERRAKSPSDPHEPSPQHT